MSSSPGCGWAMSPSKSLSVVPTRVRPYQGSEKITRPSPAGTTQAASPIGRSAWSSSRWVPRLGAIRGTSSSSTTSGRISSAQTPVALTTLLGADRDPLAGLGLDEDDAVGAAAAAGHLDHVGAVERDRAEPLGLAEHGEDEADVVGLAVVEEVGVVGVAARPAPGPAPAPPRGRSCGGGPATSRSPRPRPWRRASRGGCGRPASSPSRRTC